MPHMFDFSMFLIRLPFPCSLYLNVQYGLGEINLLLEGSSRNGAIRKKIPLKTPR